ncbi:MAG: isoprenylcysteine carboxylmethyltransferase family protein [Pyrinomonadaceae bacterium]
MLSRVCLLKGKGATPFESYARRTATTVMLVLQTYLFFGLILHKVVWEVLRRKGKEKPVEIKSFSLSAVKAVKVGILLGILLQIWLPNVLPISARPFLLQVCGVAIYTIGLLTAIAARFQLGDNWANIETGQVLSRQEIVAKGVYAYVRHPIYIGDLLLLLGLELAVNSWLVLGVLILAPIVMLKAIKEERMLAGELPGYDAYCERSKRFIPFVF